MIPKPIEDELQAELTYLIGKEKIIDRFTLEKYLSKAKSIQAYDKRKMIEGFSYAAAGMLTNANNAFKVALQSKNIIIQKNYLAYLFNTKQTKKYIEELFNLSTYFQDLESYYKSLDYAVFIGDKVKALSIYKNIYKINNPRSAYLEIEKSYRYFMENIDDFMLFGDIDKSKFDWMTEKIINICEKHKLMPLIAQHYVNRHDNSIAFITTVNSRNAEELSNLDFELALQISENDHFLKNGITGWFRGINNDKVVQI